MFVFGIVGLIRQDSAPGGVLRSLIAGQFNAVASDILIVEIERALERLF